MDVHLSGRLIVPAILLGAVLAACSGGTATESTAAETTTTAVETTATTTTAPADGNGVPFPIGEPVDLLVLTDSSGWGLAERYAALAEEALGREVRVHDSSVGGTPITDILTWVQAHLADAVAEAEIIVVYGFPGDLEFAGADFLANCFEASDAVLVSEEYTGEWVPGTPWEPIPAVATLDDWQPYRDALDAVYERIWELRDGEPTIVLTYDVPLGFLAPWGELGIEAECSANWDVQAQVIREAAEANGAGFVSVLDVFNGPNHDEDPVERGWMMDDLMHANEVGRDIIADALAAYGFEPSRPPG